MNTASSAVAYIEKIGASNIFIHLDTYHMNIEESGLEHGFMTAADHLGYVHLSETNRGVPGTGNINWRAVFKGLSDINYGGPATLESVNYTAPEIASALAIWRPVAAQQSDVVDLGLPFLQREASSSGHPFEKR